MGPRVVSRRVCLVVAVAVLCAVAPVAAAPEGQVTWGVHTTLVPAYFDPAETTIGTSFMVLYGIHDALVKPLPGKSVAPALAESWSVSPDGLVYDFVLRKGVTFHNGEPVTAEDAKFSFERYRGIHAKTLKERVAAVEALDGRLRIRLRQPWPDFMTYYGTVTTSAAWVVPKKYLEKVGEDGFKKAPVGAGPYRFVSFTPGIELVLEAFDGYWRKAPSVKRLVLRVIPDPSTRLVALRRNEVDVVFSMVGELADEVRLMPGFSLKPVYPSTHWLSFPDQWDPKSPWHDRRVRLAANHAIDRAAIDQARTGGLSRITGSIVAGTSDFFWPPPPYAFEPGRAKKLLAEAGYPSGFDAGEYFCDMTSADAAETVMGYLQAVGIRARLRPLERAAFNKSLADRGLRNLVQIIAGVSGNAATRLEAYLASSGTFAAGGAPDLDGLLREQGTELDRARREAILHRVQQQIHERAMFAPLYDLAFVNGVAPRVEESGLGLIAGYAFSAPYEDVKLKAR
ncbi:MAG TPA: ABC transporter substrate-binding protein [Candidatus Acidoferrum sp.]|nr:ABC transporter substrate-binding protein [Candidatus Acidoferrum sp.]